MSEPTKPPQFTTQLLIDLATNPLDPGYRAAAERRGGAPAQWRTRERVAVAIGCALIGFTLVVAYVHTHRSAPQTSKVHKSLVGKVRTEQRAVASLATQEHRLEADVDQLRDAALGGSGGANLRDDRVAAGLVEVKGPGLEVVLSEPPAPKSSSPAGRAGTGSLADTNILTDRDVRSVVNELWHDGAEAISVNGIRLTPTAAIRFAGEAVVVGQNYQRITPPYVIRAIGNPDDLATSFASSDVASRYHTLVSASGIGFTFNERSSLSLPAGAPATLLFANDATTTPTPSPSGTPTPTGSGR